MCSVIHFVFPYFLFAEVNPKVITRWVHFDKRRRSLLLPPAIHPKFSHIPLLPFPKEMKSGFIIFSTLVLQHVDRKTKRISELYSFDYLDAFPLFYTGSAQCRRPENISFIPPSGNTDGSETYNYYNITYICDSCKGNLPGCQIFRVIGITHPFCWDK